MINRPIKCQCFYRYATITIHYLESRTKKYNRVDPRNSWWSLIGWGNFVLTRGNLKQREGGAGLVVGDRVTLCIIEVIWISGGGGARLVVSDWMG